MDKILTKQVLNSLSIPTVAGFEVNKDNVGQLNALTDGYKYPLIVKPNTLGSSIGVKVCHSLDELQQNLATALTFDSKVLCEQALTDFCELNCAAMRSGGEVVCSRVDAPVTSNDILTFEDKYVSEQPQQQRKTEVPENVVDEVKSITKQVYAQLGFAGVVRVDYLYDNVTNKLYVNEINSIPGSLAYGLYNDVYDITQYGDILLNQALSDHAERGKLVTTFASSVLSQGGGAKHRKK